MASLLGQNDHWELLSTEQRVWAVSREAWTTGELGGLGVREEQASEMEDVELCVFVCEFGEQNGY